MKMIMLYLSIILVILLTLQIASSAHYLVGYVEDALDGTSPNGRSVRLWNPSTADELFGTVGPSGPSLTSNVFLIDCELFTTSCQVGDRLNATLVDDGSGYIAKNVVNVTVTGAGFDVTTNISMNSPTNISNLIVEDSFTLPENEIDLTPNSTTTTDCSGIATDYEGENSIVNATAEFYSSTSYPGDSDDNNYHYTNNSCSIDLSYGSSYEAQINCTLEIEYYANQGSWECIINATDNYTASRNHTDLTSINSLLSIGVNSPVDFGSADANNFSSERTIEVTNLGNVMMNLSLHGYAITESDGNSMNCTGGNISIEHTKFNLTNSNPGGITQSQANQFYQNLTGTSIINKFNLNSRQNDITNDALEDSYWRIYMPRGVGGNCTGNIIFGAAQS